MATYEYRCADGHVTPVVRAMTDPSVPTVPCEKCKAEAKRIYDAPPIKFNAPGFSTGTRTR